MTEPTQPTDLGIKPGLSEGLAKLESLRERTERTRSFHAGHDITTIDVALPSDV